jgi:hypothetical protein
VAVEFEVERFEWAADDRLELEGRWFGLRGRRFIRPMLDVEVDGQSRRLLALMEHKPWAALDGEEWLAAFSWDGDRGDIAAELAVGSDLVFELPRPGGSGKAAAGKAAAGKRLAAAAAGAIQPSRRVREEEQRVAEAERARGEAVSEAAALRRALDQKERTVAELTARLSVVETELAAARAEAQEARAAADAKPAAPEPEPADQPEPESDGAADELANLRGRLEAAQKRLDAGQRELEAAVAVRDAALGHAEQAKRERYEAQGALAAAEREVHALSLDRDGHRTSADSAAAERRELRRQRDTAISERDAALARLEEARRERDSARLAYDASRAGRPQVEGVAEMVRRRGPRKLPWLNVSDRSRDELLALRFAALVALSVVCVLVAFWILLAA